MQNNWPTLFLKIKTYFEIYFDKAKFKELMEKLIYLTMG